MKTILVPTGNHDAMRSALETALLLARRFDSYVEGYALRWGIDEFGVVDVGGGIPLELYKQGLAKEVLQARQIFESFMREHHVPRSIETKGSLSFGWLDDAPEGANFVGGYGRVFDVIVMNRADANSLPPMHNRAIESGLFESGRPILLSPPSPPKQIATNVLIAWNGSTEQTRAIAFAMPLLQRAERVTVLTIPGGAGVPGPSGDQLIRSLQRNGIPAASLTVELEGRSTG